MRDAAGGKRHVRSRTRKNTYPLRAEALTALHLHMSLQEEGSSGIFGIGLRRAPRTALFVVPKLPFWGAPPAKKEATLAAALRSEGGARGGVVAPLACASEAAGGAPRV